MFILTLITKFQDVKGLNIYTHGKMIYSVQCKYLGNFN